MYTTLLVDDEQAVLDALRTGISWQALGVERVLFATDGLAALEILKNWKVNLLITDIRMPNMDGLALLREVRSAYSDIHCILLTAYGEFEYAKTAINLGVENYLLKPFNQEELQKTIEKALDNIFSDRHNSALMFRNNLLARWATGDISDEELSERAALLQINIYLSAYLVMILRKTGETVSISSFVETLRHGESQCEIYAYPDGQGNVVCILGGGAEGISRLMKSVYALLAKPPYSNRVVAYVGDMARSPGNVRASHEKAVAVMENSYYLDNPSGVFTYHPIAEHVYEALVRKLDTLFSTDDDDERLRGFHEIAGTITTIADTKEDMLAYLVQGLNRLFAREYPAKADIKAMLKDRVGLLVTSASTPDFAGSIIELLEYSRLLYKYCLRGLSPVIQSAIKYIHDNYETGVSIKEFCTKTKMNTAYFGYLFKKETGMFFNNYIAQYRISLALMLLTNSDLQIKTVSEKVGFLSPSYFITCFKSYVGISPAKYRNMHRVGV